MTRYPLGGPQRRSGRVRKKASPPGCDPWNVHLVAPSLYRPTLNVFSSELRQFNKLMLLVVRMAIGESWQVLRSCTVYVNVRFKVRPGLLQGCKQCGNEENSHTCRHTEITRLTLVKVHWRCLSSPADCKLCGLLSSTGRQFARCVKKSREFCVVSFRTSTNCLVFERGKAVVVLN